jgi:aryl-alcohol dehydrogenase (NADP+)
MTYGSSQWRKWVLDEEDSFPFIQRALELGVNFFDTADVYSNGQSEEILGRALAEFARREEVVIATKLYSPMGVSPNQRGLSRVHIFHAIDNSLRRLRTDYVDLYQIHRWDTETPIEETLQALHEVVKSGKARYIGASSMYASVCNPFSWSTCTADTLHPMQEPFNLVYREENVRSFHLPGGGSA